MVIAPRKRDIVKRLFKAESDRDTLKSFMVDIDRKLEQFLVRFKEFIPKIYAINSYFCNRFDSRLLVG